MNNLIQKAKLAKQSGQTLIETLVAALVLVMGISAAVGLAVYGLGATNGVTKQLVAVGLAREGVEAVKNIRDSNWLSGNIADCYDFYTSGNSTSKCYTNWKDGIGKNTYTLGFNPDPTNMDNFNYWELNISEVFGLDYSNERPNNRGFYYPSNSEDGNSGYSRMITITEEDFAPFNQDLGPRLKVRVDVWWTDKRCPVSNVVPDLASCKVTLETYLTNWKNY